MPSRAASAPLPSWAGRKKPDAAGLLPVPTALSRSIAQALGPVARAHPILTKPMAAFRRDGSPWGLERTFSLTGAEGANVARMLDVLAAHELPITSLALRYPTLGHEGSAPDAAAALEAALSPEVTNRMHRLSVLLHRTALSEEGTATLARTVSRMPLLRELHVQASAGGPARIVDAAPALRSLHLEPVPARELPAVSRAPALAGLESLDVRLEADDDGIAAFLDAPWSSGLRSLRILRTDVTPVDYRGVAALPALTSLSLQHVRRAGMAAIADAPFVPALRALRLYYAELDDAIAEHLAARGLPALERLDVQFGCPITAKGLDHLVRAAPRLKHLERPRTIPVRASWRKRGRTIL